MGLRDPFSAVSHMVGAGLGIAGLAVLLVRSDQVLAWVAFSVYGTCLVLLFGMSSLYHVLPEGRARRVFQRLDHASIYLLIAGTYTPVCLLVLPPAWGWTLLGVEWVLAAAGISLSNTLPRRAARIVDGVLYLVMGWLAVVGFRPLSQTFGLEPILWLVAGGVVYTLGAAIYAVRRPRLWPRVFGAHELWHVLVLVGAAAHFVFLLRYVVPVA